MRASAVFVQVENCRSNNQSSRPSAAPNLDPVSDVPGPTWTRMRSGSSGGKKFRELHLGPACGKESRSRERNSVQIATHRGIDVSEMQEIVAGHQFGPPNPLGS